MVSSTWVYDGTEVIKTGREAIRKITGAGGHVRLLVLVEIQPLDKDVGDWKKWVDPSHLFEVRPLQ